jgi:LuxR family maltose regulon positive regulatory protein
MDQLLSTKLYIPQSRPEIVPRPRLIKRMNEGLQRKLTLISAPAGFGKTTLLSQWVGNIEHPVAWVSLDRGDNEQGRFLVYLIAALQTIDSELGKTAQAMLRSPQTPAIEPALTALINEITGFPHSFVLILDDYHLVEDQAIQEIIKFLITHMPPEMHLIISSRSDPFLPLSKLRAGSEMIEVRSSDLRFSTQEATIFLNRVMGLELTEADIHSLETRTEGWIAGLQLAAISLQGKEDTGDLIRAFSGSHRIILDYLVDEVLEQQPDTVQDFLLKTAVLDRLTGDLCNSLTGLGDSQQILEYLDQANLFIIPLDNERCWYRYHHLFSDLLRVRLHQAIPRDGIGDVAELHILASQWYEENGLEIEAFQHAAAADDIERAEYLVSGKGTPLQYRGAAALVLSWLESLPSEELYARPILWVTYASALNLTGKSPEAEKKLLAAEEALEGNRLDGNTNDIIGHIAAIRAMIAVGNHQLEDILVQSRLALEHLSPDNLSLRTITTWTLGYAYQLQGDRTAASQAYEEVLASSQSSEDIISTLAATTGLGNIQESENQLFQAVESYRRGLELFGNPPQPITCGVYLGLAGIYYEWNDLKAAQQYGQQSLELAQQVQNLDTPALSWLLLARLKLAEGDLSSATALVTKAEQFISKNKFEHRVQEVSAVRVLTLIRQGDLVNAAILAGRNKLPLSQARVHLAQEDPSAALELLKPVRQQADEMGIEAERLKVVVLQALALQSLGQMSHALQIMGEALDLAEPGGLIRTFVDEGIAMERLLNEALNHNISPDYIHQLLNAFPSRGAGKNEPLGTSRPGTEMIEPLTRREVEVLRLLKTEMSGPEIAQELVIALSTYQSHTKNIYAKLDVNNRRAAVFKAESLKLI